MNAGGGSTVMPSSRTHTQKLPPLLQDFLTTDERPDALRGQQQQHSLEELDQYRMLETCEMQNDGKK